MEDRSKRRSRRRFLTKALGAAALWKASARPALAQPADPERERKLNDPYYKGVFIHDRMTMEFWQDVERDL